MDEEDSTVALRLTRLELDVRDLKDNAKEQSKSMNVSEKSDIRTEGYIEKIFGILTDLKADGVDNKKTLEDNFKKLTITENLAFNLVTVTDNLTKDLEAVNLKVIEIEKKPIKNAEKMKWVYISFIATNLVGFMGLVYKFIK